MKLKKVAAIQNSKFSNEQKIRWTFGDKDFGFRRGIFGRNSTAIAEKNNEVLIQKVISEMFKLFFTRYLSFKINSNENRAFSNMGK